jgi:hypothetical protein
VSSRRELISWLQGLTPNEAKALFDNHEQAALQPVLKMAESNGVIFLAYVKHVMNRIFVYPCDTQFPDSISFFLHISHSLYRHIREQKRLLHSALNVASLRRSGGIAEQKQDFGFLADEMESALKALEEDLRLLAREASIREGKTVGGFPSSQHCFYPSRCWRQFYLLVTLGIQSGLSWVV